MRGTQREITRPGPLLLASGELADRGWARSPLLRYEPERIPGFLRRLMRRKEWDFYATTTRELRLAVAVADAGLAGVVAVELLDFKAGRRIERSRVTPFGRGCALPRSSEAGDVRFSAGGVSVAFLCEPERRAVRLTWKRFDGERALEADIAARLPAGWGGMVTATPLGRGFYYNRKVVGMPSEGRIALGSDVHDLAAERALTTLDWGRGVWPYRTSWFWAAAAGYLPDGRVASVNLGRLGGGEGAPATEDASFIDGRMTKLDGVSFEGDARDARRPWRFRSGDGRLDVTLTPDLFAFSRVDDILVLRSELRQTVGTWAGTLVSDEGERIAVDGLLGHAEEHRARW